MRRGLTSSVPGKAVAVDGLLVDVLGRLLCPAGLTLTAAEPIVQPCRKRRERNRTQ